MADYTSSLDISIKDETNAYFAQVDSAFDLHVKSKLWNGTNEVSVTNNRLDVNATSVSETNWAYLVSLGQGFCADSGVISTTGTSEIPFFLLKNAVASGKTARLKFVVILAPVSQSKLDIYRFYRNPTITTNGTSNPVVKLLFTGVPSSVMTAFYSPTVSNNGTKLFGLGGVIYNSGWYDIDFSLNIVAGENILVTIEPAANNTGHKIEFLWAEV